MTILQVIGKADVVLCAGPGGVGKTTLSAALALAAAQSGRRVLVLTIDPARRLADALGVTLDNQPRRVTAPEVGAGELWAMMLDPGATMDDLIRRLAPTPEVATKLLGNTIYKQMSRRLSGTLEYTAVEKLFDVRTRLGFDLVVVDTPPSKNVLDFLDAPATLARFLDERVFKWVSRLDPTGKAGFLQRTTRALTDVLGSVFGAELFTEIVGFLQSLEGMAQELRRRALEIEALLRSGRALFFVVAVPDAFVLADAAFLQREIERRGVRFGGYLVNRMGRSSGVVDPVEAAASLTQALGSHEAAKRLADKLASAAVEQDERVRTEGLLVRRLLDETGWKGFVARVPREADEVHDLAALAKVASGLQ